MTIAGLVIALPFLAAALLAAVPSWRLGGRLNVGASALTFLLACALPWPSGASDGLLLIDPPGALLALLTAFVALGAAWFGLSDGPTELFRRTLDPGRARIFHVAFQGFVGSILAALLANSLVLTWMAAELAVIAAAVAVAVPRAGGAVEASWAFLLVCGVGLVLALFGTVVLYLAASPAVGPGLPATSWSVLLPAAERCDGPLLNLAFVLLLLGFASLAGLAPMHAWVSRAGAEAPAPLAAILSCAMANVGLLTILRLRLLLAANADAIAPGPPIMALGLLSLLIATLGAWRTADLRRFLGISAVGQTGAAAFAFGLGGEAAVFAGLLHLTLHTLARAATVQCAARTAQLKGTAVIADIGGLLTSHRTLGLALAACVLALAALPPFGLFTSAFLILTEAARQVPLAALSLGAGLALASGAVVLRLQALCFGEPTRTLLGLAPKAIELVPVWVPLAVAVALGVAMPRPVFDWMHGIAAMAR